MELSDIDLTRLMFGWKGSIEIEGVGTMDVSQTPYFTFLRHIADTLNYFAGTEIIADESLRQRVTVVDYDDNEKLLKVRIAPITSVITPEQERRDNG